MTRKQLSEDGNARIARQGEIGGLICSIKSNQKQMGNAWDSCVEQPMNPERGVYGELNVDWESLGRRG